MRLLGELLVQKRGQERWGWLRDQARSITRIYEANNQLGVAASRSYSNNVNAGEVFVYKGEGVFYDDLMKSKSYRTEFYWDTIPC